MTRPRWSWRFADAHGGEHAAPVSPAFLTQFDAEAWLGSHWRELAAEGAVTAVLLHIDVEIGPVIELREPS